MEDCIEESSANNTKNDLSGQNNQVSSDSLINTTILADDVSRNPVVPQKEHFCSVELEEADGTEQGFTYEYHTTYHNLRICFEEQINGDESLQIVRILSHSYFQAIQDLPGVRNNSEHERTILEKSIPNYVTADSVSQKVYI